MDHSNVNQRLSVFGVSFVISGEASPAGDPTEGAFDDPAFGEYDEMPQALRFRRPDVSKADERSRLVKLGKALGQAIEELITLVSPSTFYRWCREEKFGKKAKNPKGGQRKPRELRELVIEIAKTTGFGYTRIVGEIRKLGIKGISRQTIRNILKEEGIKPGPDKTSDCWDNLVKRHAETLWAVDFFSVKTVTVKGLQEMYLLAFLCLSNREVIVTTSTQHPNSAWVVEQTKEFLDQTMNREQKPSIVMHDRDTKFTKEFTATLKAKGVRTNVLPIASPNLKDYVASYTSFGQWDWTVGKRLRSESFCPWLLRGPCSSGGSNRHSFLSL